MRRRTIGEVTAAVAGEDGVGSFLSSFICSLGVVQMQFGLYVSNEIHGLNEINLEVKYTIFTTWQPFSAAGAQQQRTRVTRQKRAQWLSWLTPARPGCTKNIGIPGCTKNMGIPDRQIADLSLNSSLNGPLEAVGLDDRHWGASRSSVPRACRTPCAPERKLESSTYLCSWTQSKQPRQPERTHGTYVLTYIRLGALN